MAATRVRRNIRKGTSSGLRYVPGPLQPVFIDESPAKWLPVVFCDPDNGLTFDEPLSLIPAHWRGRDQVAGVDVPVHAFGPVPRRQLFGGNGRRQTVSWPERGRRSAGGRHLTTFIDNLEADVTQLREQGDFVSPHGVLALVERIGFYLTFESRKPIDKWIAELWIAAVFTLGLARARDYYVRLVSDDPPDVEVLVIDRKHSPQCD